MLKEGSFDVLYGILGGAHIVSIEEYLNIFQEQLNCTGSIGDLVVYSTARNFDSGPVFSHVCDSSLLPSTTEEVLKYLIKNNVLIPAKLLHPNDSSDLGIIFNLYYNNSIHQVYQSCHDIVVSDYDLVSRSFRNSFLNGLIYSEYIINLHYYLFNDILVLGQFNKALVDSSNYTVAWCFHFWAVPSSEFSSIRHFINQSYYNPYITNHVVSPWFTSLVVSYLNNIFGVSSSVLQDLVYLSSSVYWVDIRNGKVSYSAYYSNSGYIWYSIDPLINYISYRNQELRTSKFYLSSDVSGYIGELQRSRSLYYNANVRLNELVLTYSFYCCTFDNKLPRAF